MIRQNNNAPFSQRQLRVGELIKQSLGQIFLRDEAKVPSFITKNITVTEVRMSTDLKNAKAYVIPLGGKDTAKQVAAGLECGITLKDFADFKEKDVIEVYKIIETERRIND